MSTDIIQYFCDGDHEWDVRVLWKAAQDLPTKEYLIEYINLSTLSNDFEDNLNRVKLCDLTYPILLDPNSYVVDGMHRLIKSILMGKETVLVKQFYCMPKPIRSAPFEYKSR